MITDTAEMPLDSLVSELFGRASRRRSLVAIGWVLALGSHAAAAFLFASQQGASSIERTPPPVEVEFVSPPEPPPLPPAPEQAPPEVSKAAPAPAPTAAPPPAARAGALHTAAPEAPARHNKPKRPWTSPPTPMARATAVASWPSGAGQRSVSPERASAPCRHGSPGSADFAARGRWPHAGLEPEPQAASARQRSVPRLLPPEPRRMTWATSPSWSRSAKRAASRTRSSCPKTHAGKALVPQRARAWPARVSSPALDREGNARGHRDSRELAL